MKKSNTKKLKGNANKFYETIKKLSQEQDDDETMLSEWEESVGFTMLHTKGIDIEPPHCVCGKPVKMPHKRNYSTDNETFYTDKISELLDNILREKDNDKKILIEQEIQDTRRRLEDRDNHVFKAKINLTVFINRKTSKTVFTGSECRKKFIKMVFGLSKTSLGQSSKPETLMKQLEKKYKVTANNPKIYVFELFTLHYKSLSNHFEELKVDKRNYECRYKDLKHIETQIVEFLEQYGETVVKIEEMDIHKNDINLMRNMKGKWEEYLCELQTYIKFIEKSKIQEEENLKKMERERILNKIINNKIGKYQKYLCIRRDVVCELNKQCLLLTNKSTWQTQPKNYNATMKNLYYNTYLEIPFKNKDVFKSEFNGKYDNVNKLWYISNYLYTGQRKKYILKYIGYEVIWRLDVNCNLQTNNNTQLNNIIFDKENKKLREEEDKKLHKYQREIEEERENQLLKQKQQQRELLEQRQRELLEQEQRQKLEDEKLEETINKIIKGKIERTLREEEIRLKILKGNILRELKFVGFKNETENSEEEMKSCACGIELWRLCKCVNPTKSKPIKTKRKTDNLRLCCSCNKYKCKCK